MVLSFGDPMFYGLARYVTEKVGKDRFEVVPHVSSMQLAFARVKESWDEAYLTNLATHPLDVVVERIRTAEKVGLFTTRRTAARAVAKALLEARIDYFTAYVCENLGSPDERVTQGELAEMAEQKFGPLNVMILVRTAGRAGPAARAGRPAAVRQPGRGVPAVAAQAGPADARPKCGRGARADGPRARRSIVWDIGAGSGSVAIEAAQIAARRRRLRRRDGPRGPRG